MSLPGARSHPGAGRDVAAPVGDLSEDCGVHDLSPAPDGPVTHEASRPVEAAEPVGATHARERADRTPQAADPRPTPGTRSTPRRRGPRPSRRAARATWSRCPPGRASRSWTCYDCARRAASGRSCTTTRAAPSASSYPPARQRGGTYRAARVRGRTAGDRDPARAAWATAPYGAREAGGGDAAPPVPGAGWLVPPAEAYRDATDLAVLRAALGEAARVIEVIDRSH